MDISDFIGIPYTYILKVCRFFISLLSTIMSNNIDIITHKILGSLGQLIVYFNGDRLFYEKQKT